MDDVIVTSSSALEVEKFIVQLSSVFPLKDLGDLSYFLGIEASRSDKVSFLHRRNISPICWLKFIWNTVNLFLL